MTTPTGWETSFKPAYESKQISSLQINANSSKTVEMDCPGDSRKRENEQGRAHCAGDVEGEHIIGTGEDHAEDKAN